MANEQPLPERSLSSRLVADVLGYRAIRSVRRLELAGVLPAPSYVANGRKFWLASVIEEVRRKLVEKGLAASGVSATTAKPSEVPEAVDETTVTQNATR